MSLYRDRFRMPALLLASAAVASSATLLATPAAQAATAAPQVAGTTSGLSLASAVTAPAAVPSAALAKAKAVLVTAAALKGAPYRFGATGPRAFDCSGYTKYVFARNGIKLPRTAQQQYAASHKISKSAMRPGDLVFFGGRYKYHVAIYAGNGMIWHAPSSGKTVRKVKIWTKNWSGGRFII